MGGVFCGYEPEEEVLEDYVLLEELQKLKQKMTPGVYQIIYRLPLDKNLDEEDQPRTMYVEEGTQKVLEVAIYYNRIRGKLENSMWCDLAVVGKDDNRINAARMRDFATKTHKRSETYSRMTQDGSERRLSLSHNSSESLDVSEAYFISEDRARMLVRGFFSQHALGPSQTYMDLKTFTKSMLAVDKNLTPSQDALIFEQIRFPDSNSMQLRKKTRISIGARGLLKEEEMVRCLISMRSTHSDLLRRYCEKFTASQLELLESEDLEASEIVFLDACSITDETGKRKRIPGYVLNGDKILPLEGSNANSLAISDDTTDKDKDALALEAGGDIFEDDPPQYVTVKSFFDRFWGSLFFCQKEILQTPSKQYQVSSPSGTDDHSNSNIGSSKLDNNGLSMKVTEDDKPSLSANQVDSRPEGTLPRMHLKADSDNPREIHSYQAVEALFAEIDDDGSEDKSFAKKKKGRMYSNITEGDETSIGTLHLESMTYTSSQKPNRRMYSDGDDNDNETSLPTLNLGPSTYTSAQDDETSTTAFNLGASTYTSVQDVATSDVNTDAESNMSAVENKESEEILINIAEPSEKFDEELSMFTKVELEDMFNLKELSNDDPVALKDILHSDEYAKTRRKLTETFGDDFWSEEVFEDANMNIKEGKVTKEELMHWAQDLSMRPHYIPNLFSTRTAIEFFDPNGEGLKSRDSMHSCLSDIDRTSSHLSPMMKGLERHDSQGHPVSANNDGSVPIWSDETLHMIFDVLDPGHKNLIELEDFIASKGARNDETREKIKRLMGKDFFSPEMFETIDAQGNGMISRAQFVYWCRANLTHPSHTHRHDDSPSVSVCVSEDESAPSTGTPLPTKF